MKRGREPGSDEEEVDADMAERERKRLHADLDAVGEGRAEDLLDTLFAYDARFIDMEIRYRLSVPDMINELRARKATWQPAFRAGFFRRLTTIEFTSPLTHRPYRMVEHAARLFAEWSPRAPNEEAVARYWEMVYGHCSRMARLVLLALGARQRYMLIAPALDKVVRPNFPRDEERRLFVEGNAAPERLHVITVLPYDRIVEHDEALFKERWLPAGQWHDRFLPGLRYPDDGSHILFRLRQHRMYRVDLNNWLVSGSRTRRAMMMGDEFRSLLPGGRPGVLLTVTGVVANGATAIADPDMARRLQVDMAPRLPMEERYVARNGEVATFQVPWVKVSDAADMYEIDRDGPSLSDVLSLTRPLLLDGIDADTTLAIESDAGGLVLQGSVQNGSIVFSAYGVPVMSGFAYCGVSYSGEEAGLVSAYYIDAVHLDGVLEWARESNDVIDDDEKIIRTDLPGLVDLINGFGLSDIRLREHGHGGTADVNHRPHYAGLVRTLETVAVVARAWNGDPPIQSLRAHGVDLFFMTATWALAPDYDDVMEELGQYAGHESRQETVDAVVTALTSGLQGPHQVHFNDPI